MAAGDGAFGLVVVDMDGTFLSPDGTISKRNRAMVETLQRKNIHFAFATGRPANALQPFVDSLGLASVPAVTFNGACLQHAKCGLPSDPVWQQSLPTDLVARIVELVRGPSLGLALSYSVRSRAIALADTEAQRERLSLYERLEGVRQDAVVADVASLHAAAAGEAALKIVGLSEQPEVDAATARAALAGEPVHVIAAEMHIEFVAKGVDKAAALERLCTALGVPIGAVVAFGDGSNDVEMLSAVGLGVAMCVRAARVGAHCGRTRHVCMPRAHDSARRAR